MGPDGTVISRRFGERLLMGMAPARISRPPNLRYAAPQHEANAKGKRAMTTAILEANATELDVDDVEYLRHGDKPLLARVLKPRGTGPFPALVECHGGAWCMSDRTTERLR